MVRVSWSPCLEEHSWVPRHADPGWRPRGDDVARHQGHVLADIAQKLGDAEHHGRTVAGLHARAVEVEGEVERLRIRHLVLGHEPRPQRSEALVALGLDPFAGAALLQAPLRHVVADAIAGDESKRVRLRHLLRRAADDESELDLEIHALPIGRHQDRVIRAGNAGGRLGEHDRHLGNRHPGLGGVIPVIETDAEEFRHVRDWRSYARRALHERQARWV